eukprot:5104934-Alexandrium_andersonii.AAC.1
MHLVPDVAQADFEAPDGARLRRLAKKATGKAAGLDSWTADHWAALGVGFYRELARLWSTVLQVGRVPQQWQEVRICGIPKEDGGERPLGIAGLAWRLCMPEAMQQLLPWLGAWAGEELAGGLPGRSTLD